MSVLLLVVAPCVGSFLGVTILRLPERRPVVASRSICNSCHRQLRAIDLIPLVSWVLLKGRCRYCSARLSVFYPAIELSALAIAAWSLAILPSWLAWAGSAFGWTLLALGAIDYLDGLLPNRITLPLGAAGLIVAWPVSPAILPAHLIGAAAGEVAADAVYIAPAAAPAAAFTWTPAVASAGAYEVYARWPASSGNTGAAQYTVTHAGGTASVTLDQRRNGGSWVRLGAWSFAPGSGHQVELAASAEGTTVADALLLVASGAQPANLLYVHPDHLGAPQKLTDTSQAVVWDGVFDPFGNPAAVTGTAAMPVRFPGQYADAESGYSYNKFRDYEPRLGRYLESDPIGLAGGINSYAYAGGNPVNGVDLRGLYTRCLPGGDEAGPMACDNQLLGGGGGGGGGPSIALGPLIGSLFGLLTQDTPEPSTDSGSSGPPDDVCRTGDDDFCKERWLEERRACAQWKGLGSRWREACEKRADNRLWLCNRNGGRPDPEEPPEWNPFRDYPR